MACSEAPTFPDHPWESYEELSDIEYGKADGAFDRHEVMSDAVFEDSVVDPDLVQAFLEWTPYERRCWLADERIGGRRAADVITEVGEEFGVNPLLLIVRMQVEASLISRSNRPSQSSINRALGCGCPDGGGCAQSTLGLEKQLRCGAQTLRNRFNDSVSGTGAWRRGRSRTTLDGRSITPRNHATAAHYAYTPWVLQGSGGNWLVWSVLRRFRGDFEVLAGPGETPGFIGSQCDPLDEESVACGFTASGEPGFCESSAPDDGVGFCSTRCAGFCPDRGAVKTFCVELHAGVGGQCLAQAGSQNANCAAIDGTRPAVRPRYVGTTGVGSASATVCVPD